jgi:16S rRNA (cytidine1402-2'-O)-methyltransferase
MGTLYIVGTPIGNLDDISKRALETLAKVDLVLAEDTRVTNKLLINFDIKKRIESYHQHSSDEKKLSILKMLMDGVDIALVSDAGTPGLSDPGNELIDFLYSHSGGSEATDRISIIPIPGPSAATTALSVCGFNVSNYLFLGFWPKKKQSKYINLIQKTSVPFVYFDSPHRVMKNLEKLLQEIGDRRVFVGRELTKMHETHYRGSISEVLSALKAEKHLKGEIVIVVE